MVPKFLHNGELVNNKFQVLLGALGVISEAKGVGEFLEVGKLGLETFDLFLN
jgi:hypothetical protein